MAIEKFETKPCSTGFIARLNVNGAIIAERIYFHSSGLEKAFGKQDPIMAAMAHFDNVWRDNLDIKRTRPVEEGGYTLAAVWGDNGDKMIDFFSCIADCNAWPGNVEIEPWFTRNGEIVPRGRFCGDMAIVLGKEEEYRRKCKDFDAYFRNPPEFG